jgi:hypothetical protein
VRVDAEDFLDELVLAEVDVDAGDGWQDRLEDGSRARVVACEEGLRRPSEVLGHLDRVGMAEATGALGEHQRIRDQQPTPASRQTKNGPEIM